MTKIEQLREQLSGVEMLLGRKDALELLDLVEMQHTTLQLLNSPKSLARQAAVAAYEEAMTQFEEWNKP